MAASEKPAAAKPAAKKTAPKKRATKKRTTKSRAPVGRPTVWDDRFVSIALQLARLGATDLEVSNALVIDIRTLYRWKLEHPAFAEALKIGKAPADRKVEDSLFKLATGYTFDSVKIVVVNGEPQEVPIIEHVPPSALAAIFWLKNRMPTEWRDTKNIKHDVEDDSPLKGFLDEVSGRAIKPKGAG